MINNGRYIGGNKHLAFAYTDDQWAFPPSYYYLVAVAKHYSQSERAYHFADSMDNAAHRAMRSKILNEMGENLTIGFRPENVSTCQKPLSKLIEVGDVSVVNDCQLFAAA
jgi:hypothetical protein